MKRLQLVSGILLGSALLFSGCGGGGGGSSVEKCPESVTLPSWSKKQLNINTEVGVKKALSPFYLAQLIGAEWDVEPFSLRSVNPVIRENSTLGKMVAPFTGLKLFARQGTLQRYDLRQANENWQYSCSGGGSVASSRDDATGAVTLTFSKCQESDDLAGWLLESIGTGEFEKPTDIESTGTEFSFDGTLKELYKKNTEAWDDDAVIDINLAIKIVKSDDGSKGELQSHLHTRIAVNNDEDHKKALFEGNGCLYIDGRSEDANLSDIKIQFADFKVNTAYDVVARDENDTDKITEFSVKVDFDGYASLDGSYTDENGAEVNLAGMAFYTKALQVSFTHEEGDIVDNDELNVTGKLGDACMGGVVDYQAQLGPVWDDVNGGWFPAEGNMTLNGNQASVTFENNEKVTIHTGGTDFVHENASWTDITDEDCRKGYERLWDIFTGLSELFYSEI
ncbi:hypothetical protein [Hydrogenimonas sp. SS33]|uniref:hypothetical protein n=1 Tax=Hydrogenimonas leucolamina TaxID=2954236 RepID=UPI00336BB0CD